MTLTGQQIRPNPVILKAPHKRGCDGGLYRAPYTVFVDRAGRIGNGGHVAHVYVCNKSWDGCKAKVLVTERTLRILALTAEVRA